MSDDEQEEKPQPVASNRGAQRLADLLGMFTAILAGLGATAVIVLGFGLLSKPPEVSDRPPLGDMIRDVWSAVTDVSSEVHSLETRVFSLESQLETVAKLPESSAAKIEMGRLQGQLSAISKRLTSLEDALGTSPSKSLAVPLLKKDLESLRDGYKMELAAVRASTDRVYDQNKWFIALMLSMAVGLLGMAISTFTQRSRERRGAGSD